MIDINYIHCLEFYYFIIMLTLYLFFKNGLFSLKAIMTK